MFNIIIVVVSWIAVRVAMKILMDKPVLPSFSFPRFSFSFFKKFKKKDVCELPDKQKDFIQLN